MEFTTTITETDFVAAYRLRCKTAFLTVFYAFLYVLVALLLLLHVSAFINEHSNPGDAIAAKNASVVENAIFPVEVFCLGYLLMFKVYLPYRMRRNFRRDPNQRGEMVVQLSPEGILERAPIGSNMYFPWIACAQWRESRRVIVLTVQSGVYFIFPKACLSSAQQDELRGILTAALPKK